MALNAPLVDALISLGIARAAIRNALAVLGNMSARYWSGDLVEREAMSHVIEVDTSSHGAQPTAESRPQRPTEDGPLQRVLGSRKLGEIGRAEEIACLVDVPTATACSGGMKASGDIPVDLSEDVVLSETPEAEPELSARPAPLADTQIAVAVEGESPQPLVSPLRFHIQAVGADERVEDHFSFFVPEQSYVDRPILYRVMSSFLHAKIFDERMGFCTRIAIEQGGMWHDVTQSVTDLTQRCITGEDIRIGSPSDIPGRILKPVTLGLEKAA